MEPAASSFDQLSATSKNFARRVVNIGGNRLELLMVELEEERGRFLRALLLALGVAGFGLLAWATMTVLILVVFWDISRIGVLLALTALYGVAAVFVYRRLMLFLRDWKTLPATLDQFRKDRACLATILG